MSIARPCQVPPGKILSIGKRQRRVPIIQGDLYQPDKIKQGNLPQDQTSIIDNLKPKEE